MNGQSSIYTNSRERLGIDECITPLSGAIASQVIHRITNYYGSGASSDSALFSVEDEVTKSINDFSASKISADHVEVAGDDVSASIQTLDTKCESIQASMNQHDSDISSLQASVSTNASDIVDIDGRIGEGFTSTSSVSKSISDLRSYVDSTNSMIGSGFSYDNSVRKEVDKHTADIDAISSSVSSISSSIGEGFSSTNTISKAISDVRDSIPTSVVEGYRIIEAGSVVNIKVGAANVVTNISDKMSNYLIQIGNLMFSIRYLLPQTRDYLEAVDKPSTVIIPDCLSSEQLCISAHLSLFRINDQTFHSGFSFQNKVGNNLYFAYDGEIVTMDKLYNYFFIVSTIEYNISSSTEIAS